MWIKQAFLFLTGLCAGGIIAAGVFAFIAVIGLVPRLAGRTHTAKHIELYEDFIVLGGTSGNLLSLYGSELSFDLPFLPGSLAGAAFGLASGVFVGSLVMSLAETLDAVPVLIRRLKLSVGLPWMILSLALGKTAGAFLFFWLGFGG
ncbi:MAG: stage V sporulation protein AB [Lachnospiraceae bacterium]|nr:stage V sporulation protein AB [Lachnospiraceae bacterium]